MVAISLIIAVAVIAVDQILKYFVSLYLAGTASSVTAIPHILDITYLENRGVAFGMFKDMRWIFIILTSAIILVLFYVLFFKRIKSKLFIVSTGLIIGGGIGNLIDRILYGYVIDYLKLSFFSPVCNFADYAITVGTVLLIVYLLFYSDTFKKESKNGNH